MILCVCGGALPTRAGAGKVRGRPKDGGEHSGTQWAEAGMPGDL